MTCNSLRDDSWVTSYSAEYIESMYNIYLSSPHELSEDWRCFFLNHDAENVLPSWDKSKLIDSLMSMEKGVDTVFVESDDSIVSKKKKTSNDSLEFVAKEIIDKYRRYGHLHANTDPLMLSSRSDEKDAFHVDYDVNYDVDLGGKFPKRTLKELVKFMESVYTNSIGVEFMHLPEDQRIWLQDRLEDDRSLYDLLSSEDRKEVLRHIVESEQFEQFLHKKFVGVKRFSGEGLESVVVALEGVIANIAARQGKDVIIGMSHRGRLNILTKVIGKSYEEMFYEFKGNCGFPESYKVAGDVKYHMGYEAVKNVGDSAINVFLCANPSHLESVNPVASGFTRARQDLNKDYDRKKSVCILLHGDAAFSGQGVVYETIVGSRINGYNIGGTVHIICNNQVGFTANPTESRTGKYASDIAKVIDSPIFHVNGYDPDSVLHAVKIAEDFRCAFGIDVFIDIISYRKYGHNETDEPKFTHPVMYEKIHHMELLSEIYAKKNNLDVKPLIKSIHDRLDEGLHKASEYSPRNRVFLHSAWNDIDLYSNEYNFSPETGMDVQELKKICLNLSCAPENVKLHKVIDKLLQYRKDVSETGIGVNWGLGEALALCTISNDSIKVRLSGQDCVRGTFSHRHSSVVCQNHGKQVSIFNAIGDGLDIEILNSYLSEYAVMGFEYGVSLGDPRCLIIWEAQFGDFANGAQIVIDQFLASAETKWLQSSGLVLLLPHAYEGQGCEHSSGRMERFLQLCAENNMQIVNCTTPANLFHVLRRQNVVPYRKPLVIFSPKSLLRHKHAISNIEDFGKGKTFIPVISDDAIDPSSVARILICTGKVYYDLLEKVSSDNIDNVLILRLEQLYPFPAEFLKNELSKYKNVNNFTWIQEEPKNMGAWFFIRDLIGDLIDGNDLRYVGRMNAASPCTGYMSVHKEEQNNIINEALYG